MRLVIVIVFAALACTAPTAPRLIIPAAGFRDPRAALSAAMTPLMQDTITVTERIPTEQPQIPHAYLMVNAEGRYVFTTDREQATAYLKESTPGVYVLDDDPANEDRVLYLSGTEVF